MKKFANVIGIILAVVLFTGIVVGIAFAVKLSLPDEDPGSGGNGGPIQEQPGTDNSDERYGISIVARLDNINVPASDYLEYNLPAEAAAGETVTFTAKSKSENFVIEYVSMHGSYEFLKERNGVYSFVMPEYHITISIHLVESSAPLYRITWDLDRTSSITLDINEIECSLPERAKAGEDFVFTITIKNPVYTIREAVLVSQSDDGSLVKSGNSDVFHLLMPAADVSILIYVDEVEL